MAKHGQVAGCTGLTSPARPVVRSQIPFPTGPSCTEIELQPLSFLGRCQGDQSGCTHLALSPEVEADLRSGVLYLMACGQVNEDLYRPGSSQLEAPVPGPQPWCLGGQDCPGGELTRRLPRAQEAGCAGPSLPTPLEWKLRRLCLGPTLLTDLKRGRRLGFPGPLHRGRG